MAVRYLLALGVAAVAAGADLLTKAVVWTPEWGYHGRSAAFAAVSFGVLAVLTALCALPSRYVAAAGGLVAGGIAGNLVSAAQHGNGVPDPFVIGPIAFALGDVYVVLGTVVLVIALASVAVAHRSFIDRHVPPRAWERRLRQRLGL